MLNKVMSPGEAARAPASSPMSAGNHALAVAYMSSGCTGAGGESYRSVWIDTASAME